MKSGGNVGIGTTVPTALLSFSPGTTSSGGISFGGDTNLYRQSANELITDNNFTVGGSYLRMNNATILLSGSGFAGGPDIVFRSAGAPSSIISPVFKIKDSSGSLQESLRFLPAWNNSTPGSLSETITTSALGTNIFSITATPASGSINFLTNVGIGTTTPQGSLDINAATNSNSALKVLGGYGGALNSVVQISNNAGQLAPVLDFIGNSNSYPHIIRSLYSMELLTQNNGNILFMPNGIGNVGIGTTSPSSNLQIGAQTSSSTATPITLSLGGTYSSVAGSNPKLKLWEICTSVYYGFGVSSLSLDHIANQVSGIQNFYVNANTTPSMTIASSGNVGIGTTSPAYKLDFATVNGATDTNSIRVGPYNGPSGGGGTGFGGGLVWIPNYTGYTKRSAGILQTAEDNYFRSGLAFFTNGTGDFTTDWSERMRISSAGNVGIGTTAPGEILTVNGNIRTNSGAFVGAAASDNFTTDGVIMPHYGLKWSTTTSKSGSPTLLQSGFAGQRFFTYGVERVRIDGSGNVGIGTSAPASTLDVNGIINIGGGTPVSGTSVSQFLNGELALAPNKGLEFNMYYNSGFKSWQTGYSGLIKLDPSGGGFQFIQTSGSNTTGSSVSPATNMTILPSGNVGIGTANPVQLLDVNGNARISGTAYITTLSRGTDNSTLIINANSTGANSGGQIEVAGVNTGTNPGTLVFKTALSGMASERMRIDSSGNVGIGTATPQSGFQLDVNGQTVTRGSVYLNGSLIEFGSSSYKLSQSGFSFINGGNVGIGTMVPNALLDIQGMTAAGSYLTALNLRNTGYNNNGPGGVDLNFINDIAGSMNVGAKLRMVRVGAYNQADLAVYTNNIGNTGDASTEKMRVTSAGNVGIGATSPGALLEVAGGQIRGTGPATPGGQVGLALYHGDSTSTNTLDFQIFPRGSITGYTWAGFRAMGGIGPATELALFTAGAGFAASERMRINGAGNVGI